MTPQYQDWNQQSGRQGDQSPAANTTFLADAVKNGIDDAFIKAAEKFANAHLNRDERNRQRVSKSQIRNVYGSVMKIKGKLSVSSENEFARSGSLEELRMLIPRVSYAANRKKDPNVDQYAKVVKAAIIAVSSETKDQRKAFERFCNGMEAILAFHSEK